MPSRKPKADDPLGIWSDEDETSFKDAEDFNGSDLESQNDEHLEGLTAKVKLLKDVSICSLSPPWLAVSMRHSSMYTDYDWHWE